MSENFFAAALGLLFLAVMAGVEALLLWWRPRFGGEARRLARRLALIGPQQAAERSVLKPRGELGGAGGFNCELLLPRLGRLGDVLQQAGEAWSLCQFVGFSAGCFFVGFFGALLLGGVWWLAVAVGGACGVLPWGYLSMKRAARLRHFERQLPEVLDLIGRALRAGHSLPRAMQLAGSELPAPAGPEFAMTVDEVNFGVALPAALENLTRRVPSADLNFFVIAVLIQRESGGNLSEVLGNISAIIRERLKLFGRVQALSAEGRFSGLVLMGLPFVTGGLLFLVDREFMSLLWIDPMGLLLLKSALVFMVVGAVWMRFVVNIRV